ncbi:hypothetical protein JOC48_001879 [Aquibacillus albus]|uniref:Sulfotransferase family protein n=1 Tax=Aquibacillus albus TaxID=1168171 RepID=A0ABS2N015_9BACI|nr:hypothetical protein [Aquibacillus albus]
MKNKGYCLKKSVFDNEIFIEKKIIFIHVPKVAGNGILKSLELEAPRHTHLYTYESEDFKKYNEFFKIGFVRNPWDRIVSSYFYLKNGGMKNKNDLYMQQQLDRFNSFSDFIYELHLNKNFRKEMLKKVHFKPQYSWMMNSIGELEMDYVGRFENLTEGFEIIKRKLNKPEAKLKNYNSSKHDPYWKYYDKELIQCVGEIYKKDIELFNYDFPYEKLNDKNHK